MITEQRMAEIIDSLALTRDILTPSVTMAQSIDSALASTRTVLPANAWEVGRHVVIVKENNSDSVLYECIKCRNTALIARGADGVDADNNPPANAAVRFQPCLGGLA